jgi:hypothetical protein
MMGDQLYGKLIDDRGGSCAMGAACLAAGFISKESSLKYYSGVMVAWPWMDRTISCPSCGCEFRTSLGATGVWSAVVHLNNNHRWLREQIADWVETIEQAHSQPAPEAERVTA